MAYILTNKKTGKYIAEIKGSYPGVEFNPDSIQYVDDPELAISYSTYESALGGIRSACFFGRLADVSMQIYNGKRRKQ